MSSGIHPSGFPHIMEAILSELITSHPVEALRLQTVSRGWHDTIATALLYHVRVVVRHFHSEVVDPSDPEGLQRRVFGWALVAPLAGARLRDRSCSFEEPKGTLKGSLPLRDISWQAPRVAVMGRYVRVLDIGLPAPGELVAALLRRNRFSPSIIRYGNFFKRSGEIGLLRDTVVTSNFYNSVPTQWGIKPKRCDLSPLSVSVHWLLPSTPRPVGLNSLGTPFMIYWVDPGDELATFVRRRRFWQDLVIVQHDHAHEKETTLQTGVELQWILSLIGTGTGFWASMEREPGLGWMSQTEYRDRFDVKRLVNGHVISVPTERDGDALAGHVGRLAIDGARS